MQAAVDEAEQHRREYGDQVSRLSAELEAATGAATATKAQVETALQGLHESDARMNADRPSSSPSWARRPGPRPARRSG
ncbi:hypothetical protein [Fodinicola feengrottensis]